MMSDALSVLANSKIIHWTKGLLTYSTENARQGAEWVSWHTMSLDQIILVDEEKLYIVCVCNPSGDMVFVLRRNI
jgi:hypothetical protein